MMSIHEILALAELDQVDAHSVQGEDVVAHSVHDQSDGDAHSVQGDDVAAHSVHGEDAAELPDAFVTSEADFERGVQASAAEILKGAVEPHRRGPRKRFFGGRPKQVAWASASNIASRQVRGQAVLYNKSGLAKTKDQLIMLTGPTPGVANRGKGASLRIGPKFKSRKIGKVGGAWKMWTPECILATAFESVNKSSEGATAQSASRTTPLQCIQTVAAAVMAGQEKAFSKRKRLLEQQALAEASQAFYITNTMFDETQLWVSMSRVGRMPREGRKISQKKRRRVLAASGQVTWGDVGGPREDADVFRPPVVLQDYTAANCANVLARGDDAAGLLPLGDARPQAKYHGSMMAADSHSVNKLVSKMVASELERLFPDCRSFHLPSFCTQHKTGNVVSAVTKYLDLHKPAFCLASLLAFGDVASDLLKLLQQVMSNELEILTPEEAMVDGLCPGDDDDIVADDLLEQCYVRPGHTHLIVGSDGNVIGKQDEEKRVRDRRAQAAKLRKFFAGKWSSKRLVHACPAGCCGAAAKADREISVRRAVEFASLIVTPAMTLPATNKYTKVDPVVRQVCLMASFRGLLCKVLALKVGRPVPERSVSDSGVSGDAAVGAPRDPIGHMRKVNRMKLQKAFHFVCKKSTKWKPLIWLATCSPIMAVHYNLFKYGTWKSRCHGDHRLSIFDFCNSAPENPVASALMTLSDILLRPQAEGRRHLLTLADHFGLCPGQWPSKVREALHVSALMAFSMLWRKLFFFFRSYPWKLAPAYDARRSLKAREQTIREFLSAPPCCLDTGLGARLQRHIQNCGGQEQIPHLLDSFLTALFERVVVTSTQVELMFGSLTRWSLHSDNGTGLPTLSAKSTLRQFAQAAEHWRSTLREKKPVPTAGASRPDWMFPIRKGSRFNHLHLFMASASGFRGMADAKAKFSELSGEEQQRLRSEAAVQRRQAIEKPSRLDVLLDSAMSAEITGGPLGMVAEAGFPMSADALSNHMGERSLKATCKEWTQRPQLQSPVCAPDFPERIVVNEPCVGVCSSDLKTRLGAWKNEFVELSKYLRLVVKHWLPEGGSPFWLLQCRAVLPYDSVPPSGHVLYILVTHVLHDDHQTQFELVCIRMEGGTSTEPPFNLQFSETRLEGLGNTWPDVLDETTLIRALLKVSTQWVFSLAVSQSISLSRYRVTQFREIPFEAAVERAENSLEEAAALRAFKLAVGGLAKARKATKKRTSANTKFGRPATGSRDKIPSSSASGFVSDTEEWWTDVVKGGLHKRAKRASSAEVDGRSVSGEVGGSSGLGGADRTIVAEKLRPAARGPRRVGKDNVLEIVGGAVTICRVMRNGECCALSLQCNRHNNAADTVSDHCARDLTFIKDLSEDEAVRRLKRWFIAGLQDADWDRNTERSQHSKLGGRSLRQFADADPVWGGMAHEDLDMLICQSCE